VSPAVTTTYAIVCTNSAGLAQHDVTVTVTPPKLATLRDDFNGDTLDTTKWKVYEGTSYTVSETGQQLQIVNATLANASGDIDSVDPYDASDSSITVNLVQPGNSVTDTSPVSWIKLTQNDTASLEIGVTGGSLYAKHLVGGQDVAHYGVPYVASMQWVRLRESAGTTYWEYAASSTGPWTSPTGSTFRR
jgi:hypothetical protein